MCEYIEQTWKVQDGRLSNGESAMNPTQSTQKESSLCVMFETVRRRDCLNLTLFRQCRFSASLFLRYLVWYHTIAKPKPEAGVLRHQRTPKHQTHTSTAEILTTTTLHMLALDRNSRKRSARHLSSLLGVHKNTSSSNAGGNEARKKILAHNNTDNVPVICLTGLTTEEKDKYHQIIGNLGGRYVEIVAGHCG